MEKPWETIPYYQNLIKEGHTKLKIPKLPELNERNEIALEIWNMLQIMPNMDFEKAADIMGIELTKTDRYFLFIKLVEIQKTIDDFHTRKAKLKPGQISFE